MDWISINRLSSLSGLLTANITDNERIAILQEIIKIAQRLVEKQAEQEDADRYFT